MFHFNATSLCHYSLVCCTSATGSSWQDLYWPGFKSNVLLLWHPFHYFLSRGDIELAWQVQTHCKITHWSWINKVTANQKDLCLSLSVLAASDNMCSESEVLVKAPDTGTDTRETAGQRLSRIMTRYVLIHCNWLHSLILFTQINHSVGVQKHTFSSISVYIDIHRVIYRGL